MIRVLRCVRSVFQHLHHLRPGAGAVRGEFPVAGSAGDASVLVRRGKAWFLANSTADAVTQTQIGKDCYVVDSQTVAKTSVTNARPIAGKVLGLENDGVWVLI